MNEAILKQFSDMFRNQTNINEGLINMIQDLVLDVRELETQIAELKARLPEEEA